MAKISECAFIKGVKKLFSKKLFLFSLSLYILIPVIAVLVIKLDNRYRTDGTYVCYENNEVVSKITLKKDNSILIESYNQIVEKDPEFIYINDIVGWGYRVSSWSDSLDPEKYPYLSKEYILLRGESKNTYVSFFKIGSNLYSSYLLPDERGGGQKCYIKI